MKRILAMSMMFALLAAPVMATTDDQTMPPEANWTPTPSARQTVDLVRLVSLLVEKGMITPQEYAQLTQPQSSITLGHNRDTASRPGYNPVLTTP